MENITFKEWELVAHSLGIQLLNAKQSTRKKDKELPIEFYRNYYNYSNSDNKLPKKFKELLDNELIQLFDTRGLYCFCITDKGIKLFRDYFHKNVTLKYKKPSASKQRYQDFVYCDYGFGYDEYLGIVLPKLEYAKYPDSGMRYISKKYDSVKGEYRKTQKEAKKSYKEALYAFKRRVKSSINTL